MSADHEGGPSNAARPHANRLAGEKSPYLLQHAHNPVDWYPWGEEAFERARLDDKPIFLSIGYSTCHWCHVMERESFEDDEVAALLNDDFVSIKLDREERPDIDGVYMTVCQLTTGHGGWPLTIVMTPDRKPFFAGTYFPKESRGGRIGIIDLLPRLTELWKGRRGDVLQSADSILAAVRESERPGTRPGLPLETDQVATTGESPLGEDTLRRTYEELAGRFDRLQGGFGGAPKFPTPHQFLFLLRYHDRSGEPHALEMVEKTLQTMRRGGIFDHVGFGFHRYSTDARWLVPHFEKMLYDQALLAMAYTETWLVTKRPEYRQVAEEILAYVLRDMTDPSGGFYSAEDADSEGREGKFYLWTVTELEKVLDEEDAQLVRRVYNLEKRGNFADEATGERTGENIPHLRKPLVEIARELVSTGRLEVGRGAGIGVTDAAGTTDGAAEDALRDRLERIRARLFSARETRIHPLKDDKVLTDWNGLMIAAMAIAGRAFDAVEYTRAAERAAGFLLDTLRDEQGRLLHRYREGEAALQATAADYAFLVWGLIELYQTTFEPRHLAESLRLHEEMVGRFWDDEGAGFFTAAADVSDLPVRQKEAYDGATPSANAVAWYNELRLSRLTGGTDLEERAARHEAAFAGTIQRMPSAYTMWLMALDFRVGPVHEVVIATPDPTGGEPETGAAAFLDALRTRFIPRAVVLDRPQGPVGEELATLAPFAAAHGPVNGQAAAYACTDFACQAPVTEPAALLRAIGLED
jgi:uncharacterized protein YyaL (SSP411 family)